MLLVLGQCSEFDINNQIGRDPTLQLADGSIWRVEPMYDETSSFYAQQYPFDANTPGKSAHHL